MKRNFSVICVMEEVKTSSKVNVVGAFRKKTWLNRKYKVFM